MKTEERKKKPPGRPKQQVRREVRAAIRFTKAEYFIIKAKAAKAGTTASDYIRQVAINATIKSRLTEEEREFVRQLIGMANNLNQLAKASHQEGVLQALLWFENYRSHLDAILEKLKT